MTRARLVGLAAGGLAALLAGAFAADRRRIFLAGVTSDGHRLIEERCDACHVPFAAPADQRCAACHRAELKADSHPAALFDDPRWAADLAALDATHCRTCHGEHRVAARGVTVPDAFCFACHDDVVRTRPSHRGFTPGGCATAGCHNYHDNSGLNRSFLVRRLGGPDLVAHPAVPSRTFRAAERAPAEPVAPAGLRMTPGIRAAWLVSRHATAGVGCADCHRPPGTTTVDPRPGTDACRRCHEREADTFHAGQHGVREALGLAPLTPGDARVPMKARTPDHRVMSCGACHDAHAVDTRHAAFAACLGCHDDEHSRAFLDSPHGALYAADRGAQPGARTVTCATCHLPREVLGSRVAVNHNNTLTLAPRDRMVRMVCLSCHSLEFSMNSIFDDRLVRTNFRGRPRQAHQTLQMLKEAPGRRAPEGGSAPVQK